MFIVYSKNKIAVILLLLLMRFIVIFAITKFSSCHCHFRLTLSNRIVDFSLSFKLLRYSLFINDYPTLKKSENNRYSLVSVLVVFFFLLQLIRPPPPSSCESGEQDERENIDSGHVTVVLYIHCLIHPVVRHYI